MSNFGVAIIAAGASSRMGRPKQLLQFKGVTFLEHAVMTASVVPGNNLCIVLGAHSEQILEAVPAAAEHAVKNEEWQEGMGSSIAMAVKTLMGREPQIDAIFFMTVDQPFVSQKHLADMMDLFTESGKPIIGSAYGDTAGIPALIGNQFFPELLQLRSDKGAKAIIKSNRGQVLLLPLPSGEIDIDTPGQYDRLIK